MNVKDFAGVTFPSANPEFTDQEWHNWVRSDIQAGDRIFYLLGSTGCGKSEFARQLSSEKTWAFLQISCKPGQELAQWVGMDKITTKEFKTQIPIDDKRTVTIENASPVQTFSYGPLSYCVENPSVILIDEPNYLLPTEKAVFQELLNSSHMTILEANGGKGKVISKHPDTIIVFESHHLCGYELGEHQLPESCTLGCESSRVDREGNQEVHEYPHQDKRIRVRT